MYTIQYITEKSIKFVHGIVRGRPWQLSSSFAFQPLPLDMKEKNSAGQGQVGMTKILHTKQIAKTQKRISTLMLELGITKGKN